MKVPDFHAIEKHYTLGGNGAAYLKVFVEKRIATSNLASRPTYLIFAALRLSVYNKQSLNINPGAVTSYQNYPAIFTVQKTLQCPVASEAANFELMRYAPATVNTAITTSRSDLMGTNKTNSAQQSVGSSTSQTNSFGVNVQGGLMMDLPMFSVGVSYDHAWSSEQNQGRAVSVGQDSSSQSGNSDTFSIKDWGIYAQVNYDALTASWVCAQEYPWDVLQYHSVGNGGNIEIPDEYVNRLLVGDCVLPPSQLSLCGTDFTFTSNWKFSPSEDNVDPTQGIVTLVLDTACALATHQRTGSASPYGLSVTLGQPATTTNNLTLTWGDLAQLALDALAPGRNDASLNFLKLPASRFPAAATVPLTLTSPTNTLLCTASGFGPGMIADVASGTASYTLAFKVLDTVSEVVLYLKHWKMDSGAIVLTISINGQALPDEFVDAAQGAGGASNRTEITLRSTDYMSDDFCNYLVVGLNIIKVSLAPKLTAPGATRYCLSAAVVS